jgi:hypothetical protein
MPEDFKDHALIHNEDAKLYKYVCGRKAVYKVGDWYMCEKHKKYLADTNKWPAEIIKEKENGEKVRGGC